MNGTQRDDLSPKRIKRFLRALRNRPFVAFVMEVDGAITVYSKGVALPVDDIQAALEELAG